MAIANGGIGLDSPLLDRINRCFADDRASAYIVGGYLRDALRDRSSGGISQHDLDIAVEGDSERIARSLARHLDGSIAPLDPTRGIFRVMAPAEENSGERQLRSIDLTSFSGSIQEDLARRDFSVDAMALHWDDRQRADWPDHVIDPSGGRRDLVQKRIRAISPTIFHDDPGRLLRSVRLASQLGFALDPETASLVRQQAHLLSRVSAGETARRVSEHSFPGQRQALPGDFGPPGPPLPVNTGTGSHQGSGTTGGPLLGRLGTRAALRRGGRGYYRGPSKLSGVHFRTLDSGTPPATSAKTSATAIPAAPF